MNIFSATVTVNGGTAPFQYSIDGGLHYQTSNVFAGLSVGTIITIKDANGCTTTTTVAAASIGILCTTCPSITTAVSLASTTVSPGGTTTLTANVAGGNTGYSFSIDGGATYQPLNN
ncbi:MAG: hypothetical protein ABIU11_05530, partial [Chitinophagaceae bacterium]